MELDQMLVVTTDEVAGHRITRVHGQVYGLTVRSRNMFSDIGAGLRGLVGGEVKGYTKLLGSTRDEAITRLSEAARQMGANAVVGMRYAGSDVAANTTEIVAYGTAVTIHRA